ncbi:MAG: phage portal protein [Chloroflexota bacterium]|nr:phage portal protein [Chloroflexota bacterium]
MALLNRAMGRVWPKQAVETARAEGRAEGYTEAALEAALQAANSGLTAHAEKTAAVEYGVGLIGRCFAAAVLEPDILGNTLTATAREQMARRLLLNGNQVFAIDITERGAIVLTPAVEYTITGGVRERDWLYHLNIPAPSRPEVRRVMSDGVVHVRIGADPNSPWEGCSPLLNAGLTSTMLARIEQRGSQEANARVGYLLPMPDGISDDNVTSLKTDLAAIAGNTALVETTSGGMGQGRTAAPQLDWKPQRLGAEFPEGNINMRREAGANIVSALGIPAPLYVGADGATIRESYRQLLTATLQPLAVIVAEELQRKLEIGAVRFNFRRLAAADIAARARAAASLLSIPAPEEGSAFTVEQVMELSGLNE